MLKAAKPHPAATTNTARAFVENLRIIKAYKILPIYSKNSDQLGPFSGYISPRPRISEPGVAGINSALTNVASNRAATVTGYGSVYQADVRTDGVSFTKDVVLGGYTLASGVSVSVAGENRTASSTAAVSPSSVILDLGDEESLADGVEFSLPSGVTAEKLLLDSSELTGTAFETTSRGLRVKADTLKTLSTGSHTLTFRLSDGQTATVMVSVTRETAAQPVQTAAFDRYYRSTNFRDISVKLEGVNAKSDIAKVVLGLTPLSYEFDEASRTLTLRRAALA